MRPLHRFVLDQLPLVVCGDTMSVGIRSPARSAVDPRRALVRVDAPPARVRKTRFDLRQPLLGKQRLTEPTH